MRLSGFAAQVPISEEDQLRAGWYALLGQLLAGEPSEATLRMLGGLSGDDSELGEGIKALAAAARGTTVEAARQEYFDLFVGLGQGELLPYASYYLTGFLNEKPLARLRDDMARLRIARADDVTEPEDHVAALCEMMAGLIKGSFGAPADLEEQRKFFDTHIGCWAPRFFEDLQAAQSAVLFMPVGTIGRAFMNIESQAFEMAA
ncbi:TorD/DmsD family molecular chaperone [Pelagibius sp.]|uniref:TorD/DmsD family molecular chaperone n=1 Tax=Pelagibius sp. TaxID=1931238 RepID=UPI003B50A073